MKKTILLFFCLFFISTTTVSIWADENPVTMSEKSGKQGRNEGTMPPVVTYDDTEGTLTVEADVSVGDVYVEVTNSQSGEGELEAVVSVSQAVLPLPLLPEGDYAVTVTTATGAVYQGTLAIE